MALPRGCKRPRYKRHSPLFYKRSNVLGRVLTRAIGVIGRNVAHLTCTCAMW